MQNKFPPTQSHQVTLANWRTAPFNKWAFHHVSELVPSAVIKNDPTTVHSFAPMLETELPDFAFDGANYSISEYMHQNDIDGLVVLHHGQLLYEKYANGMTIDDPHILMSISKSMLGLIAGILVGRGELDTESAVTDYIPELDTTAFAGARVRDLLDMRSGIDFDEDYLATQGPIIEYRKSTNWNPLAAGETPTDLRSFFLTLKESSGPHGGKFDYKSPCTDLLGWVIERATGKRYCDVFSELLWRKSGAEQPAMITVDRLGAPRVAGGVSMTTRDLARIGQLVAEGGRGIVPKEWIDDIEAPSESAELTKAWDQGSMADRFPGESVHYRSKWYVMRDRGPILLCLGIHGQNLFVDRQSGLVMAKNASAGEPLNMKSTRQSLALFEAIRSRLK